MKGFYVSARGTIQGHHDPLVSKASSSGSLKVMVVLSRVHKQNVHKQKLLKSLHCEKTQYVKPLLIHCGTHYSAVESMCHTKFFYKKAFRDDLLIVDQMMSSVFGRVENIFEIERNPSYKTAKSIISVIDGVLNNVGRRNDW